MMYGILFYFVESIVKWFGEAPGIFGDAPELFCLVKQSMYRLYKKYVNSHGSKFK